MNTQVKKFKNICMLTVMTVFALCLSVSAQDMDLTELDLDAKTT